MRMGENAIDRQLSRLTDSWNVFAAESETRLLLWITDEDNAQLVDLFFELQYEEDGSDILDLFVPLKTPFEDAARYGFELATEFHALYEESRSYLQEAGIKASWSAPSAKPGVSGIEAFLRCCFAFQHEHREQMMNLALVLRPEFISNPEPWRAWWTTLLEWKIPAGIRFTTVEPSSLPLLEPLTSSLGAKITTVKPAVNMGPITGELAGSARGDFDGTTFRRLFLEITNLSQSGIGAIQSRATQAIEIAKQQNWPVMAVTVQMLVAATHHRAGQFGEAIAAYRAAGRQAEASRAAGDPNGPKLLMQSLFGEAAALIGSNQHQHAATAYANIAPLAQQAGDPLMEVESRRMAAWCCEQTGQHDAAWKLYWQALQCGEKLDPEMRASSTLPQAGQALLRLAGSTSQSAIPIHQRMIALLGQDWPFTLQTGASVS
jgi:tetratricopeptide (TPR) repeat protein